MQIFFLCFLFAWYLFTCSFIFANNIKLGFIFLTYSNCLADRIQFTFINLVINILDFIAIFILLYLFLIFYWFYQEAINFPCIFFNWGVLLYFLFY